MMEWCSERVMHLPIKVVQMQKKYSTFIVVRLHIHFYFRPAMCLYIVHLGQFLLLKYIGGKTN